MVSNKNECYGGTHCVGSGEEISARKTYPLFYAGGVGQNYPFYSYGYYGECGQISCTKTVGDFRTHWYGIGSSTGAIFKIHKEQQKLRISVEMFVGWLANKNSPWASYCAFMTGYLIALDKQPDVHPVGIGET